MGKQNLGYSGTQNCTTQSKGNLPCTSEKNSTSSGPKPLGSKGNKGYKQSGVGKTTTGGLIAKIERGEVISCIQPSCRTKVMKVFKYRCQNFKLDNLESLYKRKLSEARATFEAPNPIYSTAEYQKKQEKAIQKAITL